MQTMPSTTVIDPAPRVADRAARRPYLGAPCSLIVLPCPGSPGAISTVVGEKRNPGLFVPQAAQQ